MQNVIKYVDPNINKKCNKRKTCDMLSPICHFQRRVKCCRNRPSDSHNPFPAGQFLQ